MRAHRERETEGERVSTYFSLSITELVAIKTINQRQPGGNESETHRRIIVVITGAFACDLIKITLRLSSCMWDEERRRGGTSLVSRRSESTNLIICVLGRVPIVKASGRNCFDDEWNWARTDRISMWLAIVVHLLQCVATPSRKIGSTRFYNSGWLSDIRDYIDAHTYTHTIQRSEHP